MEYFVSHIHTILIAAIAIAGVALAWGGLLNYNAVLKARRAAARKAEAERKKDLEREESAE